VNKNNATCDIKCRIATGGIVYQIMSSRFIPVSESAGNPAGSISGHEFFHFIDLHQIGITIDSMFET
jgi:hypothetical protein